MKDYNEVVRDVLRRGKEEIERTKRRKQKWVYGGAAMAVTFGVVVLISLGLQGERDLGERDAGIKNAAQDKSGTNNFDSGSDAAIDGGRGEVLGNGVDGDPSGYSYDPVPGGKTERADEIEEEENDPESFRLTEMDKSDMSDQISESDTSLSDGETDSKGKIKPKEKISFYPEEAVYCYAAPKDGEAHCSVPLTHAIEKYGDQVLYCVVAELFCDGSVVFSGSEEAKLEWSRLEELGYTIKWESDDSGEEKRHYYMLYATKEELEKFDASEEYGYFFRFIDEP